MKTITKEEAFAPIDGEVSIPIDKSDHKFEFTRRWFQQRNQSTWSTFFPNKFLWKGRKPKPIKMIQIGVFEGMDLVWCFQNILHHQDSRVLAVDPWAATRKLDEKHMEGVYQRACKNLHPWRNRLEIVRGYSEDILGEVVEKGKEVKDKPFVQKSVDLIVIDGDHNAPAVNVDALNALALLKKGGWMVFDDVRNRGRKKHHVLEGLSHFLDVKNDQVKLMWQHRYCDCYQKL